MGSWIRQGRQEHPSEISVIAQDLRTIAEYIPVLVAHLGDFNRET
jgi:hypothetical protein